MNKNLNKVKIAAAMGMLGLLDMDGGLPNVPRDKKCPECEKVFDHRGRFCSKECCSKYKEEKKGEMK